MEARIEPCFYPETPPVEVVPTREGYERWSEVYDGDGNPLVLLEEDFLPALLGPVQGLDIADIGCGTGRHSVRLAAGGARVVGLDFSEGMLARARAKARTGSVTFVDHDWSEPWPLAAAAFDRVLSCLTLDHVANLPAFFCAARAVCRPQARIVVSVMHPAMSLRGVQARFIDPGTGRRVGPASFQRTIADYVMAAVGARLVLDHMGEYSVDSSLARRAPRAEKHLGWPLLLLLGFRLPKD